MQNPIFFQSKNPVYIIAGVKDGKVLGYFHSDDHPLCPLPAYANEYLDINRATKDAELNTKQWSLEEGEEFVVMEQRQCSPVPASEQWTFAILDENAENIVDIVGPFNSQPEAVEASNSLTERLEKVLNTASGVRKMATMFELCGYLDEEIKELEHDLWATDDESESDSQE